MPLPLALLLMPTHTDPLSGVVGATLFQQWVARPSKGASVGNVVDLTGITFACAVRATVGGSVLATPTITNGATTGLISLELAPAGVADLVAAYSGTLGLDPAIVGYYDLTATLDGDVRVLVGGPVYLRAGISA
jgi:hypothetical protein